MSLKSNITASNVLHLVVLTLSCLTEINVLEADYQTKGRIWLNELEPVVSQELQNSKDEIKANVLLKLFQVVLPLINQSHKNLLLQQTKRLNKKQRIAKT